MTVRPSGDTTVSFASPSLPPLISNTASKSPSLTSCSKWTLAAAKGTDAPDSFPASTAGPEAPRRSVTARRGARRIVRRLRRDRGAVPRLPEPQVQGGDDEQVEQRRREQAAQNDDGHRVLDLVARKIAGHHQADDGQPGCQHRHQDRRNPFACPPQDEARAKRFAFVTLHMQT